MTKNSRSTSSQRITSAIHYEIVVQVHNSMPTKYKSGLGLGTQATPHIQNIEVGDGTPYDNKAELTQAFSLEN